MTREYFDFEVNYYGKATTIDVSKLIDTSFQEYAVAQLGPYAP